VVYSTLLSFNRSDVEKSIEDLQDYIYANLRYDIANKVACINLQLVDSNPEKNAPTILRIEFDIPTNKWVFRCLSHLFYCENTDILIRDNLDDLSEILEIC
jgi:hypothetical protein